MFNTDPRTDAQYVGKLKSTLESRFSGQRALDSKMLDVYLQKHRIEGREPAPEVGLRPVGTGFAGLLVDQDAAVLAGDVSWRVYPRGGAQAERHASDVLEPFVQTAFKVLQSDAEVWMPMIVDSRIYGRAWAIGPLPAPMFWGTDDLKEMYKRLEGEEGEKKQSIRDEIEDYYAGNFPIVWRHWNARDVFCTWNERAQPSELIYTRKMYSGDIVDRWGDVLPKGRKYKDSEQIDVLDYVNGKYLAVVVADKNDPQVPHVWEHRMGCVPVTFADAGRLPDNEQGWMWAGAAFHIREMIHALDDTLTDMRTLVRESPTSPPVVYLNVEARGQLEGWPSNIQVKQGETVNLLTDERIERAPVPQVNIDAYQLFDRLQSIANMVGVRRDALIGTGPSGQSAVHLNEANQIAKAELKRAHQGLQRGATRFAKLLFKSVTALSQEYPDAPDKVTIRPADPKLKSKAISVGPLDVKGWDELVEASIDLNLPINENAQVLNYQLATESMMLDPLSARERYGRIENPAEIDDKRHEWQWGEAIAQLATNVLLARAGQGLENVQVDAAELEAKLAAAPPFAQEVFARFSGANAPATRGARNSQREGRGQNMSQLAGTQTVLPGRTV